MIKEKLKNLKNRGNLFLMNNYPNFMCLDYDLQQDISLSYITQYYSQEKISIYELNKRNFCFTKKEINILLKNLEVGDILFGNKYTIRLGNKIADFPVFKIDKIKVHDIYDTQISYMIRKRLITIEYTINAKYEYFTLNKSRSIEFEFGNEIPAKLNTILSKITNRIHTEYVRIEKLDPEIVDRLDPVTIINS